MEQKNVKHEENKPTEQTAEEKHFSFVSKADDIMSRADIEAERLEVILRILTEEYIKPHYDKKLQEKLLCEYDRFSVLLQLAHDLSLNVRDEVGKWETLYFNEA